MTGRFVVVVVVVVGVIAGIVSVASVEDEDPFMMTR